MTMGTALTVRNPMKGGSSHHCKLFVGREFALRWIKLGRSITSDRGSGRFLYARHFQTADIHYWQPEYCRSAARFLSEMGCGSHRGVKLTRWPKTRTP